MDFLDFLHNTKINTERIIWPKQGRNCIKRHIFFSNAGNSLAQRPKQELEVGLRSMPSVPSSLYNNSLINNNTFNEIKKELIFQ